MENLRPASDDDWLLVAGDVGELTEDIERALRMLRNNFARVVRAPGNHALWTPRKDPVQLQGEERYHHLVNLCKGMGILTPEGPSAVWEGRGRTGDGGAAVRAARHGHGVPRAP